jgi:trimeric autotransporter adhesin
MQSWAKRGLQAAFFTGGMLVVGAGIANASEATPSVNPLGVPATDLVAGDVAVPVHIANNQVSTILGNVDIPGVNQTVSSKELTKSLPSHPLATPQEKSLVVSAPDSISRGNQIRPEVCVPVDISGNAIGATGNAETNNDSTISCTQGHSSVTDGNKSSIGGNVIPVDLGVPVIVDNNAIAAPLGNATAHGSSTTMTNTGTNPVVTNGDKSTLGGNVVQIAGAIPVLVNGNAIAWGGNADATSTTSNDSAAGGSIRTSGNGATVGGDVVSVPLALPIEVIGNSVLWIGNADAKSETVDVAKAGATSAGHFIQTSGDPSTGSGNIVQTPTASKVLLAGNAVSWIGNAAAKGLTTNTITAGGQSQTTGDKSTGSGNIVDPELALPVEIFGDGVTWIGNADATDINKVTATAGGGTLTSGEHSTLSANDVVAPIAGAADVFGSAGSLVGNAHGTGSNDASVNDGGYNGTLGNDAVGGGNIVGVPVALPAEVFGAGAGVVGNADGLAKEVKDVEAGDIFNTNDDRGTVSSNIASLPVTSPVQVFGDAAGVVANVTGISKSETVTTAGAATQANGVKGSGSGNIAQVPVSLPTQLFGDTATLVGNGDAIAKGSTSSTAGGAASADGHGGALTGNIADVPFAGAVQGFGAAVAGAGVDNALASNLTSSTAGGNDKTNGEFGSIAGNIAQVPMAPVVGVFGDAVSAAGISHSAADNKVFDTAGKDTTTSGKGSGISGNVAKVPAAATAQVFGDAVTVGGLADALAKSYTDPSAGGDTATSGALGSVSGNVAQLPTVANAQVLGDSVGSLGNAANDTTSWTGNFAGGATKTDGHFGAISGDIAQLPLVADAQVLDNAVGGGGMAFAKNSTKVIDAAGGDSRTSGLAGALSGDVASVPAVANAEVVHNAVSAAGQAFQAGKNSSTELAGGTIGSNGTAGSVSGDILQVPANAVAQGFGDAVSVAGISGTGGINATTVGTAGHQATSGATNTLSGVNGDLPVGSVTQVFDIPLEVFGQAVADEANVTKVGEDKPQLDLGITDKSLMGATQVPGLRSLPQSSGALDMAKLLNVGKLSGAHTTQARELPAMSDNLVPAMHLVQVPSLDGIKLNPNVAGM